MNSKEQIVENYYNRDLKLNIDLTKHIINHLTKLDYNYVNKSKLLKLFLHNKYISDIKCDALEPSKISYNEWLVSVKETFLYKNILNNIDNKIKRSILLSKYVGTNDIKNFYNDCTLEELTYLGY
jgi:hypothetical protein